jgi:predicted  nucleic acid-binding Zn-ribbon protein
MQSEQVTPSSSSTGFSFGSNNDEDEPLADLSKYLSEKEAEQYHQQQQKCKKATSDLQRKYAELKKQVKQQQLKLSSSKPSQPTTRTKLLSTKKKDELITLYLGISVLKLNS